MTASTSTTTDTAAAAQISTVMAVAEQIAGRFRKIRPEYRDSFDGEAILLDRIVKTWNVKGKVHETWYSLRMCLVDMLEQKKSNKRLQPPEEYLGYSPPLFQLRCFLVGTSQDRASPHVAVCCAHRWYASGIRTLILESQILGNGKFKHFKACFIAIVNIIQPGPAAASTWGSLPPSLTELEFYLDTNDLPGAFCGAKVNTQVSGSLSQVATVGGIVQVGERYLGMTVAHIFYTDPHTALLVEDTATAYSVDWTELDLITSEEEVSDNEESISTASWDAAVPVQGVSGEPQAEIPENIPYSTQFVMDIDTQRELNLSKLAELSHVWELSRCEDEDSVRHNLDWALITIENPVFYKPNFVKLPVNIGGFADFWSHEVLDHIPSESASVILQTSHGPLMGSSICSVSSLKIPSSDKFQPVWMLHMDGILTADCGSWAFETSSGGLIGMLIAACYELGEIYILPACHIFQEITVRSGQNTILPRFRAESSPSSMAGLASAYSNQGQWKEAEELFVQVIETLKKVLGEEHPDTLTSISNLGSVLDRQGKYKEAKAMHRCALKGREKVLREEHPDTLTSISNLGSVLERQAKYKEAEAMQRRALEGREKVLGTGHPDTLTSVNNLGSVLERQGRYKEAEAVHQRALEGREKVLGEEHPDTLTSVNNLGSVLERQGRYKEAEAVHQRALEGREKVLGTEHPDTLTSISNLGSVLERQGRYKEAEAVHERALEGREKVLGTEHPDTLTSISNLGSVLERQGRYEEAEAVHQRALEGREKVLGTEHPDTLTSVNNLGSVLERQGRYKEAEAVHRRALEGREKVLGAEHPDTLTSISNLGLVLERQAKYKEAEVMQRRAFLGREKVLGREHPDTLTSISSLGLVLSIQNKYEEAEVMHRRDLEESEKVLGAEHPDTLTSVNNLGSVLERQRKYKEAEVVQRRAFLGREKVLGPEHPDTLTSMANLASTFWNQQRWKEAEELFMQVMETFKRVLGAEHPFTLTSMNNLAFTLKSQSRNKEAILLMEACFQLRKQILGPHHPDTKYSLEALNKWERDNRKIRL